MVAVLAVGAGAGLWYLTPPTYQATISLIASSSASDAAVAATGSSYASTQAQAFAQIAGTPPAVQDAAERAGRPGATPTVFALANGDDPFLTIQVQGGDPDVLRAVADAYPTSLPQTVARLSGPLSQPVTLKVLSPAVTPSSPIAPDLLRYLGLALAVGLVVGVGIALARDVLDHTVRDADEVEDRTGLIVLGTVPHELPRERLPAGTHPRSARAEAYRQIRTSLLTTDGGHLPRLTLITSATTGEGKTSIATNVATVFTRAGHRVALVDADLRRPQVADALGLPAGAGLTDVLSGRIDLAAALVHRDDGRLAILTSGPIPANPSEALGGLAMEEVLGKLVEEYELVIVDTPPVLPVTDALVLAPKVDGVVLVARLDHVTRERLRRAQAALARVGGRTLGVVANGAGIGRDSEYRYSYAAPTSAAPPAEISLEPGHDR